MKVRKMVNIGILIMVILCCSNFCFAEQLLEKGDKVILNTKKFEEFYIFTDANDVVKFLEMMLADDSVAAAKFVISKLPHNAYKVTSKDICFIEKVQHIDNKVSVLQLRVKGDYKSYYTFSTDTFIKINQNKI